MALVEIDEVNTWVEGGWIAPELIGDGLAVTHALTASGCAAADTPNLDAVGAAIDPLDPGLHSYEKWQRWHVVDMGGSRKVQNLRFYSPVGPSSNTLHQFNGHTVQATYDTSKKLAPAAPDRTTTDTPHVVPTSLPASPNIGIGGMLAGALMGPGISDYLVTQVQTTVSALFGTILRFRYRYDDLA